MLLQDQVAIVTGGGRGIGRAVSKRFASEGARIVIAQRDPVSGDHTCQEIRDAGGTAIFVPTDLGDREAILRLVAEAEKQFGGVDILVNNAAVLGENGHFFDLPWENWDRVLAVNLTGVFVCSQAVARIMARRGRGSIINISSSNAFVPQPRCAAYGAAKGGLETLSRSMAVDLAPYGIRVNVIAPGPIQSRSPDDAPPRVSDATLLGRIGLVREVAEAVLFFASSESSFITGQSLCVDGGMLVNAYRLYGGKRPQPVGEPAQSSVGGS